MALVLPRRDNEGVRTTPLIGGKAWFGPRRLGWGLSPVSPEGWAVSAAFIAAHVVARRRGAGSAVRGTMAAALLTVVALKGTSPGGLRARRAFDEARRAGRETAAA